MRPSPVLTLFSGLCLAVCLSSCGGGGGSAAPTGPGSSPTQIAALYVGSDSSAGFWTLSQVNTDGSREWYAMHRSEPSTSSTLYSGRLTPGLDGAATAINLRSHRANGGVLNADASFSQVSGTGLQVRLSPGATTTDPESFQARAASPEPGLDGDWNGRWDDGANSNASFALRNLVANDSAIDTSSGAGGCSGVKVVFATLTSGLYRVRVIYPDAQTGCPRQGQSLNGLAAVYRTPDKQRLQFVAVNDSGSGISFRADR